MKLGIRKKLKMLRMLINLLRFRLSIIFWGFDCANQLIKCVDKTSITKILQQYGAKIGEDCDIETGLTFHNCKDYSNLIIGNNCHIGKNCCFDLRGKVKIEDNVVVSMQTTFITHQDMNKSDLRSIFPPSNHNIYVGCNTYIGANATILQGVTISHYTIIAAGAVVNKNVEPYTMVGGVPAKIIKSLEHLNQQN